MSRENKFKNKSNIELRAYVAPTLQIEDVFSVQHVIGRQTWLNSIT